MINDENKNQAVYDVIHLMITNANKALMTKRADDSTRTASVKVLAGVWSSQFLERMEDALENRRKVQATLQADIADGSWSVHLRAAERVYTVDYRRGNFLFSKAGYEWYRVSMVDPTNPSVQMG